MSAIRSGIIGAGGMIGAIHAHAVRAVGGQLAAVAGSTPQSGRRAAERLGADRAAATAEDVIGARDVDLVHVCTPNHLHAELAEAALEAGQHVVCEKPLATTVDAARRLAERARASDRVAAVPFVYRFYATVREARARLGDSDGPWLIHGSYLQDWMAGDADGGWRSDPSQGGASRAFGDIGVHWCDLMEFTTGHRITRLNALLATAADGRTDAGEDGGAVLFQTDRGGVGSVVISQVSPGRKNRLWLSFDGPSESFSFDQEHPDTLWIGGTTENRVLSKDAEVLQPGAARYARLPAGHPQGYQDSFNAFIGDVHAAIGGAAVDGLPTFDDGHRSACLTAAVLESGRDGTWVTPATGRRYASTEVACDA